MTPHILVVGEVLTDILAYVEDPIAVASDTRARIQMRPGGTGGNVAAWIAKVGGQVRLAGRIGDDASGRELERDLRERGVDLQLIRTPGVATGAVVALIDAEGERTMLPDAGANAHLAPEDLSDELLEEVRHLHLSGYVLLDERSRPAALAALEKARKNDLTTSIDPSSSALIESMGLDGFLSATAQVDFMLPAYDEGRVLSGKDEAPGIIDALTEVYPEVALTLNAEGAMWGDKGTGARVSTPAEPLKGPLRDSVGAGDAFVAGWLVAKLSGENPKTCLEAGCQAGARAVCQPGAWPKV